MTKVTTIAIDPDVWSAAMYDHRCQYVIWEILENPASAENYVILLDSSDVEAEYVELLTSPTLSAELKKIIQNIFATRERSSRITTVTPYFDKDLESEMARYHCNTAVEPSLIRMAAGSISKVTLLLIGTSTLRHRGLHDHGTQKNFRYFFRKHLRKPFAVITASSLGLPGPSAQISAYQEREFENQTRLIFMQRLYARFGTMPCFEHKTPGEVFNYRDSEGKLAGEIDTYIFQDVQGTRYVWIAECELREEGNEAQPTTEKKIKGLACKVEAATAYEQKRTSGKVSVKGYLVTNAESPNSPGEKVLSERQLHYLTVHMPRGWTSNLKWALRDCDLGDIPL